MNAWISCRFNPYSSAVLDAEVEVPAPEAEATSEATVEATVEATAEAAAEDSGFPGPAALIETAQESREISSPNLLTSLQTSVS